MITQINFSPALNRDENVRDSVLAYISNTSNGYDGAPKRKSGFFRIFTVKEYENQNKDLKENFGRWIPACSETHMINETLTRRTKTNVKHFSTVDRCLEYVTERHNTRFIVMLSDSSMSKKEVLSKFKKLPQIIAIYFCMTKSNYKWKKKQWLKQNKFIEQNILSKAVAKTHVKDLSESQQILLMELLLIQVILDATNTSDAKSDFLEFCRSTYANSPANLEKVCKFEQEYVETDAIKWYTKPDSFIFRLISKTCGSLDIVGWFKIRFFLCGLYTELQRRHSEQLETKFQQDLVVYRGKMASQNELNQLREKGTLFTTRHFLSASTEIDVALMFSGDGVVREDEISVLIEMQIDHTVIQDKPIAFIDDVSEINDENEVMIPMGLVFRVESIHEVSDTTSYSVKIKMVRGVDEQEFEKNLSQYHLIEQTGATSPVIGMFGFLASMKDGQYSTYYSDTMYHPGQEINNASTQQPTNSINTIDQQMISTTQQNVCLKESHNNTNLTENTNINIHVENILPVDENTHVGFLQSLNVGQTLSAPISVAKIMVISLGVLVCVAAVAITVPLVVFLSSKHRNDSNITDCLKVTCRAIPSVQNPSLNYQVERLDFNCSQTLTNMTIIQTVQRIYNETHAQQYQTFWNNTTNMTYIQGLSQITYTWVTLPGAYIVQQSFPHFIDVQYYHNGGSSRSSTNDTWQIWLQSICGDTLYLYGTY